MTAFEQLGTEARDAAGADLDLRSTAELVALMSAEDASVPAAVAGASNAVAALVDDVAARLAMDGRLVYVGAGTSGRLAALDAAECEATFSVEPGRVTALVAGEVASSALEQEAAEDDAPAGRADIERLAPGPSDAVVGISASGRSPYVVAALQAVRRFEIQRRRPVADQEECSRHECVSCKFRERPRPRLRLVRAWQQ